MDTKQKPNSPIFYSYSNTQFVLAYYCMKSYPHDRTMFEFIKQSMIVYLQEVMGECKEDEVHVHYRYMCNLMLSCRQQIESLSERDEPNCLSQHQNKTKQNEHGINIALCYRVGNKIYCLKTYGMEVYALFHDNDYIGPLADSTNQKYAKTKLNTCNKVYMHTKMPHIKSQFLVSWGGSKKTVHNHCAVFDSLEIEGDNKINIIIGTSQTFVFVCPKQLPKHLQAKKQKKYHQSIKQKIQALLQDTNKSIKTITKQSLNLIHWPL